MPKSRGVRGRNDAPARGADTRQAIIDAAVLEFGQHGFSGTPLRDIAARVGVTHAGLLHHFGSKRELLRAVLEYRDSIDERDEAEEFGQGRDARQAALHLTQRNQLRRPLVALFVSLVGEAASPDHPVHEYIVDRYDRVLDAARASYAELDARGALRRGLTADAAARITIATMDGLQIQWLLGEKDAFQMAEVLEELFDAMLD